MTQDNMNSLRQFYKQNDSARHILDHLASRERNWTETSVDRIQTNVASEGGSVSRGNVISVFKRLEQFGCGNFKTGRRGWPSRFKWTTQMVSVGQTAAGETEDVAELDDDVEAGHELPGTINHTFKLRPELSVKFELPTDLTRKEAERLSGFINTLPFG